MYRGTADRQHNLVLRVSDEELAKLKVLAEEGDEPMAAVVRRWIREHYATKYGEQKPKPKRRT